jgi:hypothetical protein
VRTRIAACLDVGASLAAGAALAAAAFGPIQLELGAASISVRTLWRPVAAAAVLFVVRVLLSSRPARGHSADVGTRGPGLASTGATSASRLVLGALIAASCVGWMVNLSSVVGGADSYGYVSAADRVRAARLIQPEPLASVMPFPDGIFAATPLGYVPAGRMANASVPAYPLGLPLLMAAAQTVAGPTGPFAVAPIAAVLLLVATVVVAGSWYGSREVSLLAAAMIAIDPLVFTYAIQPMSDVPAATALMAAVAALSLRRPWPIVAGLTAGLALLIRPALAPAAAGLAIVPLLARRERDWASAVKFGAPVALAAIAQGWTQWYLYGDPFGSGYGSIRGLFSWNTAALNASIYARWGVAALGPLWLAAVVIGVAVSPRLPRLVLIIVAAAVITPYLFYRPYDHWETLRFLLPVVALATVVAAAGLAAVARRAFSEPVALVAVALLTAMLAWGSWTWIARNQVLTMPRHEARHRLAGELVAQATSSDGVVMALQHSGSLRYYTDRQTVNWDRIPPGALDASVRALQANGHHVYVLIDSDAERAMFETRHGPALTGGGWLPGGQRRSMQLFEATPREAQPNR